MRFQQGVSIRARVRDAWFLLLLLAFACLLLSGCSKIPAEDTGVTATPAGYSVSLETSASQPPTLPPVQEAPIAAPADPAEDSKPFSIIWLADTQTIAYHSYNDVFDAMGKWIREQQEPYNVQYIVQTGDLVDNGYVPKQWENFKIMSSQFFGAIPYLPIAGNHDLGVKWERYTAYLDSPYVKAIPKDHTFKQGQAVYAEFRAGGQDFLIVGAGWNADVASVVWINDVLRSHPNHVAILLFHSYITEKGDLSYQGVHLRDLVVAKNPNVRLVLSGHLRGNGYLLDEFDDNHDGIMDRSVNAMLYNYQGYTHNNSGQIRMLTFDPKTRSIRVFTYSPYTDRYYQDDFFKSTEFELADAF